MQNKLYVGNLNYSTTEDSLKNLFSTYGSVKSVKVIQGKGFGFVEMSEVADADAAKEALNGQDFEGRRLRIDNAKSEERSSRGPRQGGSTGGFGRSDRNDSRGGNGSGERKSFGFRSRF